MNKYYNYSFYFELLLLLIVFLFKTATCSASVPLSIPDVLQKSKQLLLVLSPGWDSFQGTLQRYQRSAPGQAWHLVNKKSIQVVVGKNGMAWGAELVGQDQLPQTERKKQEGDGRSPAGIYELGTAFGFASDTRLIPGMKWQYLPLKATSICVDDKTSKYYNQLIDSVAVTDWKSGTSGERMLEIVPQYTWGSVISYNKSNMVGDGSCIFMHVWRNAMAGTAGCVAMEQNEIIKVLSWLDPAKKPVIAVFPLDAYRDIQSKWGLPLVSKGNRSNAGGNDMVGKRASSYVARFIT